MKKLLLFITVMLSLNLNAMEDIREKEQNSISRNTMSNSDYLTLIEEIKTNTLNTEDSDYDFGRLSQAFDKAVQLGDSSNALFFLSLGMEEQYNLSNALQFDYIKFVINLIEAISLEKKLQYTSKFGRKHRKEYEKNRARQVEILTKLSSNIKDNLIDLDRVNSTTCNGFNTSPLLLAIKLAPNSIMLKFLLAHGINVNIADQEGNTPMHMVASMSDSHLKREMLLCLLSYDADIHAVNNNGDTPFLYKNEINTLLLEFVDINSMDHSYNTLLNIVCALPETRLNLEVIEYLLNNGADVSLPNEANFAPLNTAACSKNFKVVEILQEALDHADKEKKRLPIKFSPSKCTKRIDDRNRCRIWVLTKHMF